MKLKHRHIMGIGLLVCGLLGFVSCTGEPLEQPHKKKDNNVFLTFHAAVAGASTRAGEDLKADERVTRLRIVIVSKGRGVSEGTDEETETADRMWMVEHNSVRSGVSEGSLLPYEYTFEVAPGCQKRIYLIANEEGLVDANGELLDFSANSFIPDKNTGKAPVDDYVLGCNRYQYIPSAIPMTAMYEIEVPTADKITNNEYKWPNPLYVVRTATKFSFAFTNLSQRNNVSVTSIELKNIADRMYLMPHVNKKEGNYWVVQDNGETYTEKILTGQDWVNWMVEETEKEEGDTEWLTDYEMPSGNKEAAVTKIFSTPITIDIAPSAAVEVPNAIYLPESKTLKPNDDTTYDLQEYSITIHTKKEFLNGMKSETDYTAQLPHLASLFRNTHVQVNITFDDDTPKFEVEVIPYNVVTLDPSFGLDITE